MVGVSGRGPPSLPSPDLAIQVGGFTYPLVQLSRLGIPSSRLGDMKRTRLNIVYPGPKGVTFTDVLQSAGQAGTPVAGRLRKSRPFRPRVLDLLVSDQATAQELQRLLAISPASAFRIAVVAAQPISSDRDIRGTNASSEAIPPMTLRALRERLGKTQGEVARLTSMSQSQLSRVEARRDHLLSTIRKYVRALGGDIQVVAVVKGTRVTLQDV